MRSKQHDLNVREAVKQIDFICKKKGVRLQVRSVAGNRFTKIIVKLVGRWMRFVQQVGVE